MAGGILGLDLARRYGWAVVDSAGAYVASGSRELRAADGLGEQCHQLSMSIADLIAEHAPAFVAIEAPIHNGPMTSYATARALYGYAAAAALTAHLHQVGYAEIARSTCCKAVLGNGCAKKPEGVLFARRFKPLLNSDDEADAVLVALAAHGMRESVAA